VITCVSNPDLHDLMNNMWTHDIDRNVRAKVVNTLERESDRATTANGDSLCDRDGESEEARQEHGERQTELHDDSSRKERVE
jgi:hypothetical protein